MPPEPPPAFSIHVANGLYVDNQNHFRSGPLPDAPVYEVGGGMLSLSTEVKGQVLSGQLAVLPLKEQPGWKTKLLKMGVDEEVLDFFGKASDLASNVVMVVGWAQAAIKIAQMLGILKTGKSVEQLAQQILTKLGIVQDMVADAQASAIKVALETSASNIAGARGQSEDILRTLGNYNLADRRIRRTELVTKARAADQEIRATLSQSRWELFNQSKQYKGSWAFMTDTEETEVLNPPWWGARFVPRRQLADDGTTWIDAVYSPAYKLRFDYRAALPFAMQSLMSYITMLTMAEPEFRSTGEGRGALRDYANALDGILKQMRGVMLRSHYDAYHFQFAGAADDVVELDPDGIFGASPPVRAFKRPHLYWQVGALDLCAHTDAYFSTLGGKLQAEGPVDPAEPYKLGTLNFDWLPPSPELISVPSQWPVTDPPNAPHWEIVNAQACADAANKQSEADYVVLLQASGYFQLANLQATLRHLATDPESSETVSGTVRHRRRRIGSEQVQVVGYDGLLCAPEDVTATGIREEYECRIIVTIDLQQPDRHNQIPTRILLVALTAPADMVYATVRSEVELAPGIATPVTLASAETFDWYIEKPSLTVGSIKRRPTELQLKAVAGRRRLAFDYAGDGQTTSKLLKWVEINDTVTGSDQLPQGEPRNKKVEPVTFTCQVTDLSTDKDRRVRVEVVSAPGTRNSRNIYVAVEEQLSSGKPLRTYFDAQMNTQLTFLPKSFFDKERECLDKTTKLIDYIDDHYSKSAPRLPPHVPVTVDTIATHLAGLRAAVPDVVRKATIAVTRERLPAPGAKR